MEQNKAELEQYQIWRDETRESIRVIMARRLAGERQERKEQWVRDILSACFGVALAVTLGPIWALAVWCVLWALLAW